MRERGANQQLEMVGQIAGHGSSVARTAIRRGGALQWMVLVVATTVALPALLSLLEVAAWVVALSLIPVVFGLGALFYLIWRSYDAQKPELLVSQELAGLAMEQGVYGQRAAPMPVLPPPPFSVHQLADELAKTEVEPDVLQARELYQRQLLAAQKDEVQ